MTTPLPLWHGIVLDQMLVGAAVVLTGTLLMAGHFVEVMVWAVTYALAGVAPAGIDLVYLAFDNYTTLGYADLVAPEQWRLLRPMTALNGIMLIGWSTALIIEILRRSGTTAARA